MYLVLDTNVLINQRKYTFDLFLTIKLLGFIPCILSISISEMSKKYNKHYSLKETLKSSTLKIVTGTNFDKIFLNLDINKYSLLSFDRKLLITSKKKGYLTYTISKNNKILLF